MAYRPTVIHMMHRLTILLLLLLALSLSPSNSSLAASYFTVAEPTRLTVNGGYDNLLAWQGDTVVAVDTDGEVTHWAISAATGNQRACTTQTCVTRAPSAALAVEVAQTHHRLRFNGQIILESDIDIPGQPALSPDGETVVISRTPRGAETLSLGELWRYDRATAAWTQLTFNGVEESAPLFSPDGKSIAFLRAGDIWLIPADHPTYEMLTVEIPRPIPAPLGGFDHVPPAVIRVKHIAAQNNCRPGVPDGQIIELPFEEYIKRVVPHESPPSYPEAALKAQAIAARTYAWRYVLANPDAEFHVNDTTAHQYMCDSTYPTTNAAVDATAGQHLTIEGELVAALFSAENASPTRQNAYGHVALSAVDDPLSFGTRRRGHGQGYSQVGGRRLADAGWGYIDILLHYYTATRVEPAAGQGDTLLDTTNRPPYAYVRGSAVLVDLNAANVAGTQAREYYRTGGNWQVGNWVEDADGSNGYRHLFQIAAYSDVPLDDYRVEFAPLGVMRGGELPVLYLGIDRTPPSLSANLALSGPIAPGTPFNATLTTEGSDGLSGVAERGWSIPAWQEQAEQGATYGTVIADGTASGGAALRYDPASHSHITYSTASKAVSPGYYRVWVRLRTPDRSSDTQVATIRVFDDASTPLQRGVGYILAGDFPPGNGWTWFYADVDSTAEYTSGSYAAQRLTVQVEWYGQQQLDIDEVLIATRPADDMTPATVTLNNPDPVRVYAADGAGNVTWRTCSASYIDTPPTPPPAPAGWYKLYLPLLEGVGGAPAPGNYEYSCN